MMGTTADVQELREQLRDISHALSDAVSALEGIGVELEQIVILGRTRSWTRTHSDDRGVMELVDYSAVLLSTDK